MSQKILVTGGTGLLGSEIVRQLISRHLQVSILTTKSDPKVPAEAGVFRGDLRSGAGLKEALAGVQTVIHCASSPASFDDTDIKGTTHLLAAVDPSSPPHLVYISIVGIEKSSYPYYVAKRAVEQLILESGIPCAILRTTQFHEFVLNIIRAILDSGDEIALVPDGIRFQSVDLREVAGELIRISQRKPVGLLPEFGGPEIQRLEDMFEEYLRVSGTQRRWKAVPVASPRYDNFRTGINIVPEHRSGKRSWTQFLASRFRD